MIPTSRKEAKEKGLDRYFTGERCKRGHISERKTRNAECIECSPLYTKKRKNDSVVWREQVAYAKAGYAHRRRRSPSKRRRYNAERRCSILNRTPKWADLIAMKEFYEKCPEGCQVDHVIPLRGELVSGLHVLNNLQYLTAEDNNKKSNKYEVA